ncbi:stealth conserved region 3 domain-containing protein [Aeromonas sp. HMWF014]|uniref:stealth conserved region 3 domain-containing protein n=1 Tax=Aeromonas sp. HMWF014 TaxID=2056850 RepID=UPI000D34594D|nr:stealth conserved region 3 domain-containing protein [Aeromonas sp. HMWF014]PTT55697.1 hypothetical protein DBR19_02110 [Aeromonas sp. HMWF014]
MSFAKKTKKLLRNPVLYYKDSKINHRIKSFIPREKKELILGSKNSNDWLERQVKNFITDNSRVAWIDGISGEITVALTKVDFSHELAHVIASIETGQIEIAIFTNKGIVKGCSPEMIQEHFFLFNNVKFRFVHKQQRECKFYLEVQIWKDIDGAISAPKRNHITMKIRREVISSHSIFCKGTYFSLSELIDNCDDRRCYFDVDYVFTWVNADDAQWMELYNQHSPNKKTDATSESRFVSRDELKYAIRSIEMYASWVRNIYVVSNCAIPSWLDITTGKVIWVDHKEIINSEYLPTFNSHAIESCLHKIDGLSNYFIYANDDIILARPAEKTDFFEPNGNCKIKMEPYGNVVGNNAPHLPDYLNASINSQRVLNRKFGYKPTQLHRHTHQALRVDLLEKIEKDFYIEVENTRCNKFRTVNDINITSFLFHHYAYYTGNAVKTYPLTYLIKSQSKYKDMFKKIISQKNDIFFDDDTRALTVCINDGNDSHKNMDWNISINVFLSTYLPNPSSCEK